MAKRKRHPSLAQIVMGRMGVLQGGRVMTFILCWAIAEEAIGHVPTVEEYADWWKESRATAYREQARFRQCFPEESTPQRIVDLLKEQRTDWRRRGVNGLGQVQLAL